MWAGKTHPVSRQLLFYVLSSLLAYPIVPIPYIHFCPCHLIYCLFPTELKISLTLQQETYVFSDNSVYHPSCFTLGCVIITSRSSVQSLRTGLLSILVEQHLHFQGPLRTQILVNSKCLFVPTLWSSCMYHLLLQNCMSSHFYPQNLLSIVCLRTCTY